MSTSPILPRSCNVCQTPSAYRVEVRLATQRFVVCGACAVRMAIESSATGATYRIVAFIVCPESRWVASDGSYWRQETDCTTRQRMLDARAERFAERVRSVIARHLATELAA